MTHTPRVLNSDCRPYVEQRRDFIGSNLYGFTDTEGRYVVYSYGPHFPIYVHDNHSGRWFGNSGKYSQSTTRHQSQAKPHGVDIEYVSTEQLKRIIDHGVLGLLKIRVLTGREVA